MQHVESNSGVAGEPLSLWELGRLMIRHWVLVTCCVLACGSFALSIALLTTPRYRSEAVLSVGKRYVAVSARRRWLDDSAPLPNSRD